MKMPIPSHWATFVLLVSVTAPVGNVAAAEKIDFSRDILPLLSNNCFQCHGPDEEQREAELRLDVRERALADRDSGSIAIVPFKSQASAVVERITTADESERMPPPDSGNKLSDDEIARIVAWIDAGAPWGEHWAFRAPKPRQLTKPVVGWKQNNSVDHFIHISLQENGLQPEV
ncbi:MAG TPA: c-type cytochrome, partial [Planctomycetes bacterium]|nr:c-type cytochrome [Planctomycetota bacterium]